VLLEPSLRVIGFGVKIISGASLGAIYDGRDFALKGTRARRVDASRLVLATFQCLVIVDRTETRLA